MNTSILTDGHARFSRVIVLLATLVALTALASFGGARSSEAADPILTMNPSHVNLGSVSVDGGAATQTVTVTNTGDEEVVLGGVQLLGTDTGAFRTSIGAGGLNVAAGGTATFTVSFDPVKTGLQNAVLRFNSVTDTVGNTISGAEAPDTTITGQGVSANNPGNCTITGSNRSETLRGTAGRDVICGLGGSDRINGLGANDVLKGGMDNDRLTDKKGKDKLLGQGGKDRLNARDRNGGDLLKGGGGKDRAIKDKKDRARSI